MENRLGFSYREARTVQDFAVRALDATTAFVEGILEAFEESIPDRLRR